jgi:hypothetical protein
MDILARHAAHILVAARDKKVPHPGKKDWYGSIIVEPSEAAEEDWSEQVAKCAAGFGAMNTCLPSYSNVELSVTSNGDATAQKARLAKGKYWPKGILDFARTLKAWEDEGDLRGLEITTI